MSTEESGETSQEARRYWREAEAIKASQVRLTWWMHWNWLCHEVNSHRQCEPAFVLLVAGTLCFISLLLLYLQQYTPTPCAGWTASFAATAPHLSLQNATFHSVSLLFPHVGSKRVHSSWQFPLSSYLPQRITSYWVEWQIQSCCGLSNTLVDLQTTSRRNSLWSERQAVMLKTKTHKDSVLTFLRGLSDNQVSLILHFWLLCVFWATHHCQVNAPPLQGLCWKRR